MTLFRSRARRATLAGALVVLVATEASAQYVPPNKRNATVAEVVTGNILIGGLTAATHALLAKRDPFRAFAKGAIGGAVVVAGKHFVVEPGTGWLGIALNGTGTSMVHNAGRGAPLLDEITVPLPGVRFRFRPAAESKVRVAVNAYELVEVVQYSIRDDLRVDWEHTRTTGALMFRTIGKHVETEGTKVNGAATGPIGVVSAFAAEPDLTARHEAIHIHQAWFVQEAWGRPIEDWARRKVPLADRIPSWLELGVTPTFIYWLEYQLVERQGTHHLMEAEAGLLADR